MVSLLKPARREQVNDALIRNIGGLLTVDGGIVSLRLCAGEIAVSYTHLTLPTNREV